MIRLGRSDGRRTITYPDLNIGGGQALHVVVFATRYGPVFHEGHLAGGWSMVGKTLAYGPWVVDETRADVYYVVAARYAPAGESVVTYGADPAGIDWDVGYLPEIVHGAASSPWRNHARGYRSVSMHQADISPSMWLKTSSPLTAPTDWGVILASPGEIWLQSPDIDAETNHAQVWQRSVFGDSPQTVPFEVYSRASYLKPDGTSYEHNGVGAQARLHRIGWTCSTTLPVPLAPVLAGGVASVHVVSDSPWTLSWQHRPGMAGPQARVAIRVAIDGATRWWDMQKMMLSATEVINDWPDQWCALPAGAFARGKQWSLSVATASATSGLSEYSAWVAYDSSYAPTAAVAVAGRDVAGDVSELQPSIIPGGTTTRGGIESSTIRVLDAAGVAVANGVTAGTGAWRPPHPLSAGESYTAEVTVTQTGGAVSAPAVLPFTVAAVVPPTPVVRACPWLHDVSAAPGVRLDLEFATGAGYDWGLPLRMRVERQHDSDGVWQEIAHTAETAGTPLVRLGDWLPPEGSLRYRVRGEQQHPGGSVIVSEWGVSDLISMERYCGWLMPYGLSDLAVKLRVRDSTQWKRRTNRQVTEALGGWAPRVSGGRLGSRSGQLTVMIRDHDEREALMRALDLPGATLLYAGHPERVHETGKTLAPERIWMKVDQGELSATRLHGISAYTDVVIPWVEVEEPS